MNKDELNLLLYLETRAVDDWGRITDAQMNDDDRAILTRWTKEGFVESGRICASDLGPGKSTWVKLSDAAWTAAGAERKARSARMWNKKPYETTAEKRA